MNLIWFRNDLRVNDNPALSSALENKQRQVVAVYCLCANQWAMHDMGNNQQWLVLQALSQLKVALAKLNIPLVILESETFQQVPNRLSELCGKLGVSDLFFNMEYPIYERRRDKAVVEKLADTVKCHRKVGQSLVAPWEILNGDGGGYKVFSAYARKVQVYLDHNPPINPAPPTARPAENRQIPKISGVVSQLPSIKPSAEVTPDISEDFVNKQLQTFCRQQIGEYKANRDFPAIQGTSELSSALAVGTLSVARCYQTALQAGYPASSTWVNELVWRDFYRSVMWNYPRVSQRQAFNSVDKFVPWNNDRQVLEDWQSAKTGIPIIDAAMRQLNTTGWMHNRLRMIVASYLTKNLFVDWRHGEAYFAQQLFDFDFASNNGGWQWSASVGTDAAPYFRVFNPAAQQKKFDPQAEFIKAWLPELKAYSSNAIHKFETAPLEGYPRPQVDLKATRKLAIESFKRANAA
ncbi:cryptochrome/photolyase family protein [Aliikangiella marina]|nr:deoxyribodipyrimidine photo-lyase [Aliikangiella marina]